MIRALRSLLFFNYFKSRLPSSIFLIVLTYENLKSYITCASGAGGDENERELEEYAIEHDANSKTVDCWIESEDDKNFTVHCGHTGSSIDYDCFLYVDGIKVHKRLLRRRFNQNTRKFLGIVDDGDTVYPFKFSKSVYTDKSTEGMDSSDLGVIELQFFRVRLINTGKDSKRSLSNGLRNLKSRILSEKDKLLAPHRINLGNAIPLEPIKTISPHHKSIPYDESDRSPYITFRFHYGPRGKSQAKSIIPAPTRLISLAEEQDDLGIIDISDDLDDDEPGPNQNEITIKTEECRSPFAEIGSRSFKASYTKAIKREILQNSSGFNIDEAIDLTYLSD